MKTAAFALSALLALTACSNSADPDSSSVPDLSSDKTPAHSARKVDTQEITSKTYTLKQTLNFANAHSEKQVRFSNTNLQHEVVVYSYDYVDQRRIDPSDMKSAPSSCSLTMEGPVTEKLTKNTLQFDAGKKLLKGQIASSYENGEVFFSLQLQGAVFLSFFVECHNVYDSAGIEKHLGNWLDIK